MSPVDLAGPPRRRVCRDRGTARRCGLGATRGAQTGGVRPRPLRGAASHEAEGRSGAAAPSSPRAARPPGVADSRACAGHWCHPWRCGRLCGACSRVWPRRRDAAPCAGCGRGVGLGGLGPASRPSSGDLGRHPGRAVSGHCRPRPRAGAGRPAHPYAVVRRTRRRGGAMRGPAVRTGWGRRRAGTACACCAR